MKSQQKHLRNGVAALRAARQWSQERLATVAGISRAEVSAVETGRLVPSTTVALALAKALSATVESLFDVADDEPARWAESAPRQGWPFWEATVGAARVRYPIEATGIGTIAHDGVSAGSRRCALAAIAMLEVVRLSKKFDRSGKG